MHALEKVQKAAIARHMYNAVGVDHAQVLATNAYLHMRFDHVQRIEQRGYASA